MTIKAIESSKGPAQVFEPYAFRGVKNSVRSGVKMANFVSTLSVGTFILHGVERT